MPGRPIRTALLAAVAKDGGWDRIIERIADGETVLKIAAGYNVSRNFFATILHEDAERGKLVYAARKRAAEALTEEALAIVDSVPESRDALQKAKLQVDSRQWLAGKLDREQFGEAKPVALTQINIGQLHLDALRAQPKRDQLPAPKIVDAEIVPPTEDA